MISIHVPGRREPATDGQESRPGATRPSQRFVLPAIPDAVLERHGARVLRPSEAAVVAGVPRPSPTVYRYGVLLIPDDQMDADVIQTMGLALRDIGVRLVPPERTGMSPREHPAYGSMPRPVRIAPLDTFSDRAVDAWTVLQWLRARSMDLDPHTDDQQAQHLVEVLQRVVPRMTLDHLLVGSAVDGVGSAIVGTNTASNGSPDLSDLFGRPTIGTSGRIPVTVALDKPARPSKGENAKRRPVVAVLDTGIAADPYHPWLEPLAERPLPNGSDPIVIVDPDLQNRITSEASNGQDPTQVPIDGFADRPSIEEPLLGLLSTHAGHGTFIAGLIRQLAPGAQIYVVRVMHPDGFAHEADLIYALTSIADQVEQAHKGVPGAQIIDVLSLSLGYFHETDAESAVTTALEPVLRRLIDAGVTVVAAAGNFSTSREFYPAALATDLDTPNSTPMISVGALNPNTSTARFSDEASWVMCYASGAAIVSTFPAFQGALQPPFLAGTRQSFDPDDFTSMFGIWSGTSFAAPVIAGCIAAELHDGAGQHDGPGNEQARGERAREAWNTVQDKFATARQVDE